MGVCAVRSATFIAAGCDGLVSRIRRTGIVGVESRANGSASAHSPGVWSRTQSVPGGGVCAATRRTVSSNSISRPRVGIATVMSAAVIMLRGCPSS